MVSVVQHIAWVYVTRYKLILHYDSDYFYFFWMIKFLHIVVS